MESWSTPYLTPTSNDCLSLLPPLNTTCREGGWEEEEDEKKRLSGGGEKTFPGGGEGEKGEGGKEAEKHRRTFFCAY